MLREAKRQSTSEELRSRLGLGSIENPSDVGVFVGMVMVNVWTQTHALGRWTRQSLLIITLGAAQGRHGYNVLKSI